MPDTTLYIIHYNADNTYTFIPQGGYAALCPVNYTNVLVGLPDWLTIIDMATYTLSVDWSLVTFASLIPSIMKA